jgi:hypothetical protein
MSGGEIIEPEGAAAEVLIDRSSECSNEATGDVNQCEQQRIEVSAD